METTEFLPDRHRQERLTTATGLLQERRELVPGHKMVGYQCTITVVDIDETLRAVEANGGRIAAPKAHIPTVGTIACSVAWRFLAAAALQPATRRRRLRKSQSRSAMN